MTLLLDTHVLVWLVEGSAKLSPKARRTLDKATQEQDLAVSPISFWEVAMLEGHGRLTLSLPVVEWRRRVLDETGAREEPLEGDVLVHAVQLPGKLHLDPADRILVATARLRDWQLATHDDRLLEYARAGHVSALRV